MTPRRPPSLSGEAAPEEPVRRPAQKRAAGDLSEERLHEAALAHLNRYDASVEQLRRVLSRRIARETDEFAAAAAHETLERVLGRLQAAKLLDDRRFAEGFAAAARQKGGSARKIQGKLAARGVAEDLVTSSLAELGGEGLDDLAAARVYARKRRLLARDLSDPHERQKALASLARQGFSFEVALRALEEE